ncbi:MAG: type 4a pilus biogenesis protein PilO [Phycisphaerales bacterium]|jgi:type IV pilus assembly protein PilO|nr:type 4a pilus biogenesis protein PilO [Phycisphaerales bacterium]NUQ67183.1 type 4a pilus biogenesis protein PilO [Phycisphaerales bacterium]
MRTGFQGLVIVGIVVGMPVASYYLVFRPQNREIERAKNDLQHKESLLIKLREETARNADLAKANEEIRRGVKIIEARLPSTKEIDALVRQVSDLALASGLKAPAIKSSRPVPAALYMEQPLELEVMGNFVGFFSFVAAVEKLPRITRIHDMKLTGLLKDEAELQAQFTLSIYFQDEKRVASAEEK